MTYLDRSGSSGDSTDGAGQRRRRARHVGAAPEPYVPSLGDETLVYHQPFRTAESRRSSAAASTAEFGPGGPDAGPGFAAESRGSRARRSTARPDQPVEWDGTDRVDRAVDQPADRPAGASAGQRRPGRAGRNLPAAIGVGVGLGAAVLASLLVWPPAFLAVLVLAVGVGIWEMTRAVRPGGAHPPLVPLLVGGEAILLLAWFGGPDGLALGLLLTVLAVVVWRLSDGPARFQRDVTSAVLITVYVPFLGSFAALLTVADEGHFRVLATLAAVVLSDTGGYIAGVFLGRHPMAPTVSPKKSWEGFAGSVLAAATGSALLLYLLLDVAPWRGALFGVALSVVAVLGDLAESMIKRDLGIKDMSSLLPGHGGLMDRLDSILFALPASFLMLSLLVPPPG